MSSEITFNLDAQNTKYIYWATSDCAERLQNLLDDFRIYWTTSEFTGRLQNLLDDFRIYWTTSEFTERLQIFTERLGFWKLKFRVLLDPAEVYYALCNAMNETDMAGHYSDFCLTIVSVLASNLMLYISVQSSAKISVRCSVKISFQSYAEIPIAIQVRSSVKISFQSHAKIPIAIIVKISTQSSAVQTKQISACLLSVISLPPCLNCCDNFGILYNPNFGLS